MSKYSLIKKVGHGNCFKEGPKEQVITQLHLFSENQCGFISI